jgi:purine-binding chemotaxis protein CheW
MVLFYKGDGAAPNTPSACLRVKDVKAASDVAQRGASVPHTLDQNAQWVVFSLDAGRYALPLHSVDRIVWAVHVTALPQAPAVVLGAIDVAGRILPVFNVRQRFGLLQRNIDPADQFLIARTTERTVVLAVDAVIGVFENQSGATIDAGSILPGLAHVRGAIQIADGLVLIHDLEAFLSTEETRALDAAMNGTASSAD